MARKKGSKNTVELPVKEPTYEGHPDKGCELYPTCLGNDEYLQCPFARCIEDLSKEERKVLRKWFLGKL